MNKLSRKLMISIFTLVLTFVALGATTFAWFSLGTTAKVDPFDVEVKGSEGLEINFDGKSEWFTTINSTKMAEYLFGAGGTFEGKKLDAVTTADGKTFTKFTDITSTGVVTQGPAAANTDYIEFTLNFRTKKVGQKLNLNQVSLSSIPFNTWEPDVEFVNEQGVLVTPVTPPASATTWAISPHHAARVSFTGIGGNTVSYQDKLGTGNIGYELTKGAHNYVARKYGLASLAAAPSNQSEYADDAIQTGTLTEPNIALSFSTTADALGYFNASVTVRIWIEGWDGNAYDSIFDKGFSTGFGFVIS